MLIARNELDVSEEITNAVVPEQRADGSYPGEVWLPVFLSRGVVRRKGQKGSKARSGNPRSGSAAVHCLQKHIETYSKQFVCCNTRLQYDL